MFKFAIGFLLLVHIFHVFFSARFWFMLRCNYNWRFPNSIPALLSHKLAKDFAWMSSSQLIKDFFLRVQSPLSLLGKAATSFEGVYMHLLHVTVYICLFSKTVQLGYIHIFYTFEIHLLYICLISKTVQLGSNTHCVSLITYALWLLQPSACTYTFFS